MEDKTVLGATAIIAIAILEGFALYMKVDGTILALALAAIAGIAGYEIKALKG